MPKREISIRLDVKMRTLPKTQHILQLSASEKTRFLDSFDIILSDCDGVVWLLPGIVPFAGEAVNLLKQHGKAVKFVSNNSMRPDAEYLQKFKKIGANNVTEDDLMHPIKAITKYIQMNLSGGKIFSLCSDASNDYMKGQGIDIDTLSYEKKASVEELIMSVVTHYTADAVVADANLNVTFTHMMKAFNHLRNNPQCQLLVGAQDGLIHLRSDVTILGFMPFWNLLAKFADRKPIGFGKPSPYLGKLLRDCYNIRDPKRCLFIGDALVEDISFGLDCGFQTLYVATRDNAMADMNALEDERKPDFIAEHLGDFVKFFEDVKNN